MPELLQDTLDVVVDNESYVFTIPTYADEIRLGMRERAIRVDMEREALGPDATVTGLPTGDYATEFMIRTAAQFAMLCRRGPKWVWSDGPNGEPVADYKQWTRDKVDLAARVGSAFQDALARFRASGPANKQPDSTEAVAGKPDTPVQPIRPDTAAA